MPLSSTRTLTLDVALFQADFLTIFQRGKGSRVGFSAKKQQEILHLGKDDLDA